MSDRALQQYLQRHTEVKARRAVTDAARVLCRCTYAQAVVVPLFDEPEACLGRVFENLLTTDTLVIAVVNTPENTSPEAQSRTQQLLHHAADTIPLDVLVIDCVGQPLSAKTAVGEARKIGTDVALLLHSQGLVESPWLYQTDADAQLPADYFQSRLPACGAVVFGHTHQSDNALLQQAVDLYDRHMDYYRAGLAAAGSNFAFPTLGSTIAVHAHSYAAVRGYPKRNAAEDFYLLNKVAKVDGVHYRPDTVIDVTARLSQRVPFGTGPALQRITAGLLEDPSGNFYQSYHPASFQRLREALGVLGQLAHAAHSEAPELWQKALATPAGSLLECLGFDRVREPILAQYANPNRRLRALNEWFDGAKTLRFIHQARHYHPDQSLLQTLASLPRDIARHLKLPTGNVTPIAKHQ
jgi:hypothetical protein